MSLTGSTPPPWPGGNRRTEAIRRSMVRTMTAVGIILSGVAALAVAALVLALRAGQHRDRAEAAERQSQDQLWRSWLDQAGTIHLHGTAGRRLDGLEAVRKAAAARAALYGPQHEDASMLRLRDEAAALLALTDVGREKTSFPLPVEHAAVAVDAAHGLYATASQDERLVRVYRLADGAEVLQLDPGPLFSPDRLLTSIAWRPPVAAEPDKSWLTACYKNGEMAVWSLPSGKTCLQWHPKKNALLSGGALAGNFSPDGRRWAWFSENQGPLHIFDLTKGEWVPHAVNSARTPFALRPGKEQIALAAGHEVRLLDLPTGAQKQSWKVRGDVHQMEWSPSGQHLAVMLWNGTVLLYPMDGTEDYTLSGHTGQARALVFSPDGRTLMTSSSDGSTRWWDTGRGTLLLTSHAGCGLAFTPDGQAVFAEKNDHTLVRWDILPSPVLNVLTLNGGRNKDLRLFDLSPDGRWLAVMAGDGIEVRDLTHPGAPPVTFGGPQIITGRRLMQNLLGSAMIYTGLAFEPDGSLLVAVNGGLLRKRIQRTGTGPVTLADAPVPEIPLPPDIPVRAVTASGDGRRLLLELTNNRACVVDSSGAKPPVMLSQYEKMTYHYGPASVTGAGRFAISGDGRFAAFGYGMNKGLTVFDAATGAELYSETGGSLAIFNPDNSRLLTCRTREFALLQHDNAWTQERVLPCPGQVHVSSGASFSSDGNLLALAITPQTTDLRRGMDFTKLVTLTPPTLQNIRGCRMALDGSRLVVGLGSNEIQVWNLQALRSGLKDLGLDWSDSASATTSVTEFIARPAASSPWMLAGGLAAASLAAAAASVFLLRRHRGLIRSYSDAEALVEQQRADLDRANAGLFHSEKMKSLGTLAAGMAHDFNNLLSVIRMSGKLIARETRGQDAVTEHTGTIENAVLQGKQVVRSILGYSRSGADDGGPRDAASIVDDAVVLLSTEFLSGISLTLDLDRGTPPVAVPADRIEQILLNLIINASEAMNGRGKLTITVRTAATMPAEGFVLTPSEPAPWVEIGVCDSGPGVAPEIAQRIFEPFFTTKNAGNQRGTGLGLSMVHTIAGEAGIGITLTAAPDGGAAFNVFLPPVRETPGAHSAQPV